MKTRCSKKQFYEYELAKYSVAASVVPHDNLVAAQAQPASHWIVPFGSVLKNWTKLMAKLSRRASSFVTILSLFGPLHYLAMEYHNNNFWTTNWSNDENWLFKSVLINTLFSCKMYPRVTDWKPDWVASKIHHR